MYKYYEQELKERFKTANHFDRIELYNFYKAYEPDLKEGALSWRVHDLLKRGIIRQIKRSMYSMSQKNRYQPNVSDKLIKLSKTVSKDFNNLDYCVWTTEWLNYFTRHQLATFFFIIEVERDFLEEVFNAYNENNQLRVFLNPDKSTLERYLNHENVLVIKPLISRSPKQKISNNKRGKEKINVPTIEKILVDIFCDEAIFYSIQGKEMETIFENAINHYQINFTRLMSYASRRKKELQLNMFLRDHFSDLLKEIINDKERVF